MKKEKNIKQSILSFLLVTAGNLLQAMTIQMFIVPVDFVAGGTTGLSMTLNYYTGFSMSAAVLIMNISLLLLGLIFLGKKFALNSLASSLLYPFFLEVCQRVMNGFVLTDNLFLCTIFAGLGIGISLAMIMRGGGSTGGMDIPPLILNKYFRLPVSAGLYGVDLCILLSQAMFRPIETMLYGIVLIFVYSIVLDKAMVFGKSRTEIKIVSKRSDEICRAILDDVDRGVTLLHGEGGYSHDGTQIVLSVVSNREIVKVERVVREIDPECFMVMSRVSEVRGKGFSISKKA